MPGRDDPDNPDLVPAIGSGDSGDVSLGVDRQLHPVIPLRCGLVSGRGQTLAHASNSGLGDQRPLDGARASRGPSAHRFLTMALQNQRLRSAKHENAYTHRCYPFLDPHGGPYRLRIRRRIPRHQRAFDIQRALSNHPALDIEDQPAWRLPDHLHASPNILSREPLAGCPWIRLGIDDLPWRYPRRWS